MADGEAPKDWLTAGFPLPPEPDAPARLPSITPVERVRVLLARLDGMDNDHERVCALREELRAVRGLVRYLAAWRSFYCIRLWLADVPTHLIAKAAGVADSYVSRRARQLGLPPRRIDKRRDD